MADKKGSYQRIGLITLLALCMIIVLISGINYLSSLRRDLSEQAVQNVLTVTKQQQQAFDNFVSSDRERLRSFAKYYSQIRSDDLNLIRNHLDTFYEEDARYTVLNLDSGLYYNNKSTEAAHLSAAELTSYRSLTGSGVRSPYIGLYSNNTVVGYYECFTFSDGVRGILQKSYDRTKMTQTFSLSFYNDQGFAYVVDQKGDILLRSNGLIGDHAYDNIFEILSGAFGKQSDVDEFISAINSQETGSMTFSGEKGRFIYTYVPIKNVDQWYFVSVVPEHAILEEADRILLNSQQVLFLLLTLFTICAVILLLIWHTNKAVRAKNEVIEYQEQLFDIMFSYLSGNMNDVYLMLDKQHMDHIEYISPNVERVLGVPSNLALEDLSHWKGADVNGEPFDSNSVMELEPGESIEGLRSQWVNPRTGEQRWFLINVYCTLIQGNPKLIIYISDRTKEKRSEETLSEALKLAQVASSAKSAFLSSVSHDIRTPMNAIIGFSSLLYNEAEHPDMVREYTQRIESASNHLLELINDVLDMNKIESGGTMLNLSELALPEIIEEINTIIRPQTNARNQTFEIFASSLTYEHLIGDKLRINQILINLLSNAVKYTREGGRIQLHVEELSQILETHSRVRFTVRDNGIGMSKEYLNIIFEPFTREENNITHQIQGTGFGMAITKNLVDLMGGTIRVESELGEGSTFTVELEMKIQKKEDDSNFWDEHSVRKMIVADDEEEVCLNIVKAMEPLGVVTEYATGGKQAIDMMRSARESGAPYDLVLLDWKMPDFNGLETAQMIRRTYSEKIPILLFTAYDWGEIEHEAKEIGINHFMPKPFFISTFKEAIRRIMGSTETAKKSKDDDVVRGKNILVVDDIEVNRIILVKILDTLGAKCEIAENGEEAVEKFERSAQGTYDLILMDVQMPVMDGYTATRTIRAGSHPSAKAVPIIAMTANAFVDDVRDAINAGMDAHVSKPIQLDKLKATVQQVFDNRAGADTKDKNSMKTDEGKES